MIKVEYGILPADDFTNGGIEKAIIEQIENSKIGNCYIDDTISKINSSMQTYELTNYAGETYILNCNTIELKSKCYKLKRHRKPKLRKRHSF